MPVGHVEVKTVEQRSRRRRRIRQRIRGSAGRPRLSVFRSSKHIYAQIIDDDQGHTLVAASSRDLSVKGSHKTKEIAGMVGKLLAERAKEAGVQRVAFDRGGYLYHGRVKALAEGAREGGLAF
jgi:large subunit ribosomal protein L18